MAEDVVGRLKSPPYALTKARLISWTVLRLVGEAASASLLVLPHAMKKS